MENKNLDPVLSQQHKPTKKSTLFVMGFVACVLAYIITKNVTLSPFILVSISMLAGVLLLFGGFLNPQIVTYALVAYLPFSKELAGDFGGLAMAFNFTNVLMGFLIIIWLTGKFSQDEPLWLSSSLNLPVILFMGLGLISVIRGVYYGSGYLHYAFIEYKRWITPIFLYFLVLNTVKDREMIKNIIIIMCIVITIVGLMAIYEYLDLGNVGSLEKARIGGIADQPNMLAAFFNYYMFLPFGFLLMNLKRFKYWLLLIPFAICFRGIMVTFSRGGYLSFAFALYGITFLKNKFLFLLVLFATWLVILNPVLMPAGIHYRLGQTIHHRITHVESLDRVEDSIDGSSRSRIEVWKGGLAMVKDHPMWGVGYGLFAHMIRYYWSGGTEIDAHNTYLMIAAEMGIPTLMVFLWIVMLVLWHTRYLYQTTKDSFAKATALGFLGGIFGLLMSNMFGSRLDSQEISSYFWILAAIVIRLKILDQKPNRGFTSITAQPKKSYKLDAVWTNQ